nr:Chain E, SIV V2 peptide [Simian immunodeficiency virus]8FBW_F Chain F, SIV V2 peptide [Simian immunodeficiency virus]
LKSDKKIEYNETWYSRD